MKILLALFLLFNTVILQANDDLSFEDEFNDEEEPASWMIVDPLSSYNKFMTNVNDFFYTEALEPASEVYSSVLSHEVRSGVNNFFNNLYSPISIVNNILQFEFKDAGEELARFVVNSTVGIGGIFDPARSQFDLEPHTEDFGQTLGAWGVGSGFHIVLPFLGPSNLRDSIGLFGDYYINPLNRIEARGHNMIAHEWQSYGINGLRKLNTGSLHRGEYKALKKDALDLYPFLRDVYEQHRKKVIGE